MEGPTLTDRLLRYAWRHQLSAEALLEFESIVQELVKAEPSEALVAATLPMRSYSDTLQAPLSSDVTTVKNAKKPLVAGDVSSAAETPEDVRAAPYATPPFPLPERYDYLSELGVGGMGEVHRVRDRLLNRPVAIKVLQRKHRGNAPSLVRFVEEAQVTAQLQHPGIVPVHDLGVLPDGRHYFTMKEVRGQTLSSVIQGVHKASSGESWCPSPGESEGSPWTFRRLIHAFHQVCEAVGYAHSRGVVHRDLKPSNIMVGAFGEVLVMDWGLVRVRDESLHAAGVGAPGGSLEETSAAMKGGVFPEERVVTERGSRQTWATCVGQVEGTPSYMPPEQARGDLSQIGPSTDVYALGAVLYEILSGRAPYDGTSAYEVLWKVLSGSPPPVWLRNPSGSGRVSGEAWDEGGVHPEAQGPQTFKGGSVPERDARIPEALVEICEKAMSRDARARYRNAGALAEVIGAWQDEALRRERAEAVVQRVSALPGEVALLRQRAKAYREAGGECLAGVKGWEAVEKKLPGWNLEDEGERLDREADLKELEYVQGLRGALTHAPELEEAYARLASHYAGLHREAEMRRDEHEAAQCEVQLKAYDRRRAFASYLKGEGAVTFWTDPEGAEVELYRYERWERRLIPKFVKSLGPTPLTALPLAMGSYLLEVRAPGRAPLHYPVHIGRAEHWDGVRPGSVEPHRIRLPGIQELGPNDCYVPPGWFWSGGDPIAVNCPARRRVWVDGFVMRRFPVRNREYLEFLNDLVAQGREEEALRWVPRERAGQFGAQGAMVYGRDETGRFTLIQDADGDQWLPEGAVTMLDSYSADAYAGWERKRSGQDWRLPYEVEWEKAARGVDGRWYAWGDYLDPSWACVYDSHASRPQPPEVDSYPVDVSVYGVRGMGGNVRDWCLDAWETAGPPVDARGVATRSEPVLDRGSLRVLRGGSWWNYPQNARASNRYGWSADYRYGVVGFRLSRSWP